MSGSNRSHNHLILFGVLAVIGADAMAYAAPDSTDRASKAQRIERKTASAVKDTAITADLKTKFALDSKTKGSDLGVKTDHGIVALSGAVVSQAQKNHVIFVARHTKGVAQVDSTALNVSAQ